MSSLALQSVFVPIISLCRRHQYCMSWNRPAGIPLSVLGLVGLYFSATTSGHTLCCGAAQTHTPPVCFLFPAEL